MIVLHSEVLTGERTTYGDAIVATVSRQLVVEYGQSSSAKRLARMVQFAQVWDGRWYRDRVLAFGTQYAPVLDRKATSIYGVGRIIFHANRVLWTVGTSEDQRDQGGQTMVTVTIQEAQAQLLDLIHRLNVGDEVVITENDQPVAKLARTEAQKQWPCKAGSAKGKIWMAADFDAPLDDFTKTPSTGY